MKQPTQATAPRPPDHLPRPRLLRRITRALHDGPVQIIAPPGYGKSVLLREYAAAHPGTTIIALRPQLTELAVFKAHIEDTPATAPLLIDDIQLLEDAPETAAWLVEQLRAATRPWLLAGRMSPTALSDPALAWTILAQTELAFTRDETQHVLRLQTQHTDNAVSSAWHTKTGGWPLAVALATHTHAAPNATPPAPDLPTAPQSPHIPPAIEQLMQLLLDDLPADLRSYMLISALPERFSHSLCSDLLGLTRTHAAHLQAEILRRNLFVQADTDPGWYRYHDLIRDCLIHLTAQRQGTAFVVEQQRACAAWFHRHDDLPAAIDHALHAHDSPLAAAYMHELSPTYVVDQGMFRTYLRWVSALDTPTQAANPDLLITLGRARLEIGDRRGAHTWLRRALDFAQRAKNHARTWEAQTALAKLCNMEGDLHQALALCAAVIAHAPTTHPAHLQALNASGNAYTQLNRFRMARRCFDEALALTTALQQRATIAPTDSSSHSSHSFAHSSIDPDALARMQNNLHHNLAIGIHIPMGQFEAALDHLRLNARYYATRPVARSMHLLAWCAFHEGYGDWAKLARDLAEIEAAEAQSEHPDEENIWYFWFKALYHTGVGEYATAQEILDEVAPMMVSDEDHLSLMYAQVWLLRRKGELDAAEALAQEVLASNRVGSYYRGMLALELVETRWARDSQARPAIDNPVQTGHRLSADPLLEAYELDVLPQEIDGLLSAKAAPWLLRLRAQLACICHAQGAVKSLRTQRHRRAVLHKTEQKFYCDMLTYRDPELGLAFWSLCLEDTDAATRAHRELVTLAHAENGLAPGQVVAQVTAYLDHVSSRVRAQVASLLADLGQESTLPRLIQRLEVEAESTVGAALEDAVHRLEAAPPPPLYVTLMGAFSVVRGDVSLGAEDWHRPAVRRLFQYFALHAGEMLSRERILDDLWPDSAPDAARNTFRTLFSWLRRALDPYLRPKAPARYFLVAGEIYCFAPEPVRERIHLDMLAFEASVQATLARAESDDLPQIEPEFLQLLESWSPLLPELPYEPWAVTARERITNLYVEGCLHAAQVLLNLQRGAEAAQWARRAIDIAPWLEEAYQTLMQAQARLGQRSLALRTYAEAVRALQHELDVPPTALTEWLAQRLRQGEDI